MFSSRYSIKRSNCTVMRGEMCKKEGCHGNNKMFWVHYLSASLVDVSVVNRNITVHLLLSFPNHFTACWVSS